MGRGPGVRVVGPEAIQLDFRWKNQRHRPRVRLTASKANEKYCRAWKRRIEDEIRLGTFVWEKHFPNIPNPCVLSGSRLRDVVLAYVRSLAGQIQPETTKEYEQCSEIVCKGLGNPTLDKLTRAKLREWVSKQQLSKNRIDNLLTPIRGALKQAVEDGAITSNPLEGFEVKRITTGERVNVDPFTPAEVEALGKTELGDLWTFWAWSGLRSGEVIGLVWGDVDAECSSVTVRRAIRRGREKSPKTSAGVRGLRLLAPARSALLRERRSAGDDDSDLPVFRNPNTGGNWHEAKALNRAFARACRDAKVRRRYVYQLRHTFATWALSAGENPAWIAKQMGHTNTAMLFQHYGKWMPQLDPKAGSRMVSAAKSKAA